MNPTEFKEKYRHHLTVGKMKEYLKNYPDDALVVSQRVEDIYYEKHNWETLKKPNPLYEGMENQYTPVWSPVLYNDDKEIFYLDLHY